MQARLTAVVLRNMKYYIVRCVAYNSASATQATQMILTEEQDLAVKYNVQIEP